MGLFALADGRLFALATMVRCGRSSAATLSAATVRRCHALSATVAAAASRTNTIVDASCRTAIQIPARTIHAVATLTIGITPRAVGGLCRTDGECV